jgi:hypothetical protein
MKRQTEGKTDRSKDRCTERQTDKQTVKQRHGKGFRWIDRQKNRQTSQLMG